jgi:hypothetical protein
MGFSNVTDSRDFVSGRFVTQMGSDGSISSAGRVIFTRQ